MTHSEAGGVLGDDEFLVAVLWPLAALVRPVIGPPEMKSRQFLSGFNRPK